jgi:regulator of RNase E activity RraA
MKAEPVTQDPAEPYKLEMEAIDTASDGDVLLVDGGFDTTCGFWGELLTTACVAKGIRGIVMSASTRDLWALNRLDFPVFGIGAHPADSRGRLDVAAIHEPVKIGSVSAKTGDLILGDQDGVVILPEEIASDAIGEAWDKVHGENTVRDELSAGVPVSQVFRKYGIL